MPKGGWLCLSALRRCNYLRPISRSWHTASSLEASSLPEHAGASLWNGGPIPRISLSTLLAASSPPGVRRPDRWARAPSARACRTLPHCFHGVCGCVRRGRSRGGRGGRPRRHGGGRSGRGRGLPGSRWARPGRPRGGRGQGSGKGLLRGMRGMRWRARRRDVRWARESGELPC